MNINVTELKIIASQKGKCFRFSMMNDEMVKEQEGKHNFTTYYIVNKDELELALNCLKGNTKFYPYFDDGLYHIKLHPQGLLVLEKDSSSYRDRYFYLPGKKVAEELENFIARNDLSAEGDFILDLTAMLPAWKEKYSPNVKVIFGEGVEESLKLDQVHPLLKEKPRDLEESLIHWASQYSDGNLIEVHIYFDDWNNGDGNPKHYYWYLWDKEKEVRIVNGGFIAHKYGEGKFRYAMHT